MNAKKAYGGLDVWVVGRLGPPLWCQLGGPAVRADGGPAEAAEKFTMDFLLAVRAVVGGVVEARDRRGLAEVLCGARRDDDHAGREGLS